MRKFVLLESDVQEIKSMYGLSEATPPAAPPGAPAEAGNEEAGGSSEDEGEKLAKSLMAKTDRDIRKILLRYSQQKERGRREPPYFSSSCKVLSRRRPFRPSV